MPQEGQEGSLKPGPCSFLVGTLYPLSDFSASEYMEICLGVEETSTPEQQSAPYGLGGELLLAMVLHWQKTSTRSEITRPQILFVVENLADSTQLGISTIQHKRWGGD